MGLMLNKGITNLMVSKPEVTLMVVMLKILVWVEGLLSALSAEHWHTIMSRSHITVGDKEWILVFTFTITPHHMIHHARRWSAIHHALRWSVIHHAMRWSISHHVGRRRATHHVRGRSESETWLKVVVLNLRVILGHTAALIRVKTTLHRLVHHAVQKISDTSHVSHI